MENSNFEKKDQEIIFSKSIKAGKRIYYLDVKQSRNGELFLAITESKKRVVGTEETNMQVVYEKHKIFLYKEDFDKFKNGLNEVISFINEKNSEMPAEEVEVIEPESQKEDKKPESDYGINFTL
ncbi:MAG: DUF3276 family protein [Sphingobacteriia bacterium]|jgi:hypothetical protein|nr:DUF3276 family protein [Paludibacteraceae bacterium]NCA79075.1 DUF3276 family protein [Sphingobacteriia bacterium]